ncbi:MAG: hypothetical protein KDD06_20595 [Phaeodactylibacter sp.]|nr:hypothetical protein [Phaeodactylibacter sp.]MCB9265846.1 hypothetical protein [Lewinellaceae bacterium]MCB9288816.1 hypothetical protein [Lewinellaceae bacterium]
MDPAAGMKKEYSAEEMGWLYSQNPYVWLLLEVLEYNEAGQAKRLRLLKASKDKNELYDFLMEEDEDWGWDKNYIFVYADPDKECQLYAK